MPPSDPAPAAPDPNVSLWAALGAVLAAAADRIAVFDEHGVVLYANPAEAGSGGRPAADLVGRSLADLLPADEALQQQAHLQECLARDQAVHYYAERPYPDGPRWYEVTLLPLHTAAGPRRVLATARAVTARRFAEQAAAEHGRRLTQAVFAAVFEHAPFSIAVATLAEQRLLAVNPAFTRQTGYSAEECLGQSAAVFNLWVDDADRRDLLAALQAHGFVHDIIGPYRRKSGEVRRSLSSAALVDLEGQPAILSISQDVSPQYEAEERFRAALRHSPVVVFNQDLDLRYTWVGNPTPPLRPETVLGRTDAELLPPEPAARLTALKQQVLASGAGLRAEIASEWAGRPFIYDLTLEPLRDAAGAIVGLTGVSVDTTARRLAEAELARSQALLELIHQLGAQVQASLDLGGILAALARGVRGLGLHMAVLELMPDQEHIRLLGHSLEPAIAAKIESLLGRPLPALELPAGDWRQALAASEAKALFFPRLDEEWLNNAFPPAEVEALARLSGSGLEGPLIFAPMISGEQVLGWLEVWGAGLRETDRPAYTSLANHLASALENARLVTVLKASQSRLAALSAGLVDVQEAERRAVARELHDEIGQALTGLQLLLENAGRTELAEARAVLADLIGRVQALSLDLRPALLDDLGLGPALRWHVERFQARTGLRVDLSMRGVTERLDPRVETTAYRIVQEALTNAARHAGVGQVWVRAWLAPQHLGLEVTDEGRGFDVAAALEAHLSTGLSAMRERVQLLGGRLEIDSTPGEGTQLLAELPLQPGPQGAAG